MSAEGFNLFFAIFPDEETAAQIKDVAVRLRMRHGLKGETFAQHRFHVSLHGLGSPYERRPAEIINAAQRAAERVTAAPFDVVFDRADSFDRNKPDRFPLVLLGHDELATLIAFHKQLGLALRKSGLGRFAAPRFEPHVTLLYGDKRLEGEHPIAPPVSWTVKSFALVWSHAGKTRYETLGAWPLLGET
ncbi:2'-5' RNA ligase family protein [Hyphococcus luteus]|uniref:2'-5' RNA ligase n=1 Tax=Hyphococcus luteus TaxID=2058213 RepID=A0A2S7JZJ5_9PROT|nr:2'-5' RNA ligase family protein [Marinicaulis flavus]PQA85674.1 2'-5' RNA ligase [Marinicaulis flavus]